MELETLDLGLTDEQRIENEKSTRDPELFHYHYQPKTKRTEEDQGRESTVLKEAEEVENPSKRRKLENSCEEKQVDEATRETPREEEVPSSLSRRIQNRPQSSVNGTFQMICGRPIFSMKGHTAFLTFAIKSCS